MIINDDSHDYTCTDCGHTGRPCMEAIWLCQQLTQSIAAAAPAPRREMTSSARFEGCGFPCEARVRISRGDVQIFCGIEDAQAEDPSRLPRALVLAAPAPRDAKAEARSA